MCVCVCVCVHMKKKVQKIKYGYNELSSRFDNLHIYRCPVGCHMTVSETYCSLKRRDVFFDPAQER